MNTRATMVAMVGMLFLSACSVNERTDEPYDASSARDATLAPAPDSSLVAADASPQVHPDASLVPAPDSSLLPAPDSSLLPADASSELYPDAGGGADAAGRSDAGQPGLGLAAKYPRDLGIGSDPAVVWAEAFEEGSVAAVTAHYDDAKNTSGMELVEDVPAASGGARSMRFSAGVSHPATDLFKVLPAGTEWYVRWYAKYQAGIHWHHSGVWFGGYNPVLRWPNPQAGSKPAGDDRLSVAVEPVYGLATSAPRMDFYNYWMGMHSWMDQPQGDGAYWGNALIHRESFALDEERWICLEAHLRLNDDPGSAGGAVLEVWKNDALVQRFDGAGPLGYWIRDKFCPQGADGDECTDYPDVADTVLDLQMRTTTDLTLNYFWPQNYVTEGPDGWLQFDDMVVATERVGCLHP